MAVLSPHIYIFNFLLFLLIYIFEIQIQLNSGEAIVKVTGCTGRIANIEVVRSLKFITSHKRELGPYPPNKTVPIECTPFNLPIEDGRKVVGFKGVTDGVLNAIGVHSVPLN